MKSLNKTETPIFLSVVGSLFPKAIFLTFIKGGHNYIGMFSWYTATTTTTTKMTSIAWKVVSNLRAPVNILKKELNTKIHVTETLHVIPKPL